MNAFTILIVLTIMYFVPGINAKSRKHPNAGAIFALNFFLGWTLLGWIIALVWSFTNPQKAISHEELAKLLAAQHAGPSTKSACSVSADGFLG